MTRDFAFVVDAKVKAGDIVRAAQNVDRKLITSVTVFDVYEGKGIEPGKKSIAIAVTLQPREKTMTDEEIEAAGRRSSRRCQSGRGVRGSLRGCIRRLPRAEGNRRCGIPGSTLRDARMIRIRKPIALDRLADRDVDPPVEHRPRDHARVKLALLAARVGARRQFGEQRVVEAAAGE